MVPGTLVTPGVVVVLFDGRGDRAGALACGEVALVLGAEKMGWVTLLCHDGTTGRTLERYLLERVA